MADRKKWKKIEWKNLERQEGTRGVKTENEMRWDRKRSRVKNGHLTVVDLPSLGIRHFACMLCIDNSLTLFSIFLLSLLILVLFYLVIVLFSFFLLYYIAYSVYMYIFYLSLWSFSFFPPFHPLFIISCFAILFNLPFCGRFHFSVSSSTSLNICFYFYSNLLLLNVSFSARSLSFQSHRSKREEEIGFQFHGVVVGQSFLSFSFVVLFLFFIFCCKIKLKEFTDFNLPDS